ISHQITAMSFGVLFWVTHCCPHSLPFLSRHIGSTPGDGPSGMHVQPLVPCLSTFMLGMSTIVALGRMAGGAADIALLIFSESVAGGLTGPTFGAPGGACLGAVV